MAKQQHMGYFTEDAVEVTGGFAIQEFIQFMSETANETGKTAVGEFNGFPLRIEPDGDPRHLLAGWDRHCRETYKNEPGAAPSAPSVDRHFELVKAALTGLVGVRNAKGDIDPKSAAILAVGAADAAIAALNLRG